MIIWANLDCEATWAGVTLPLAVRRRISAAGTLMAAFAPAGEPVEIWTPEPVDPARVRFRDVTIRAGKPERWDLAWAEPSAKELNDRRVAFRVRDALGVQLPGARIVESLAELDDAIAACTSPRWVAKAVWTAAGRDRVHGVGPLGGESRVYARRLLETFGALVFEPWLDRILDLGICATLGASGGMAVWSPHTLRTDPRGNFLGIDRAQPWLSPEHYHLLAKVTALRAADPLHARGYVGPYGIDAFVYRDGDEHRLNPLCELNARHTFGYVATRLGGTLGFGEPPPGATILVAPGDGDPTTAWSA